MVILINSLFVEVYDKPSGVPKDWQSKAVRIYDPQGSVTEGAERAVIQYLYSEGFIEDRRVKCDIITGEDCND
ncbi:hypothetical protein CMI37_22200 [Candidatus Pacearchaeota archaeon]|nr:hypothetical protein [Candidatus Pacearchaeota archaeon]|tara:strand:- start:18720 stop:18938 length:219 start_codon:yes stop_codon:yes gene_type:complete